YFDWVCFGSADQTRGLLNIGGIGNLTVIPRGSEPDDVTAFDTGPGNMVVDALARHFFDAPFDSEGALASRGTVDNDRLASILGQEYFTRRPPKSTGREAFGEAFAREAGFFDMPPHDALATATALTAFSVYQAYARFVRDQSPLDALIVSGGGVHNRTMMEQLSRSFAPIPVMTADEFCVDSDAKEALCFAILAHETVNGRPTNLPSVTGASRPTILGKICVVMRE
ncbi:MAG TPA: anhydro-N-acetylmuramic acid kinase, partial [Rhodothermales bacterium]